MPFFSLKSSTNVVSLSIAAIAANNLRPPKGRKTATARAATSSVSYFS